MIAQAVDSTFSASLAFRTGFVALCLYIGVSGASAPSPPATSESRSTDFHLASYAGTTSRAMWNSNHNQSNRPKGDVRRKMMGRTR